MEDGHADFGKEKYNNRSIELKKRGFGCRRV